MSTPQNSPSSGPVSQYQYTPIQQGQFRLLTLHSGEPSSPLVATLFNAPLLGERRTPYYEALSYTWGSMHERSTLMMGTQGGVDITANLRDALIRLRHTDRPRTLWIDAVCINQEDNQEKTHQVVLMTHIYSVADKVLVFLGEADHTSAAAMTCIEDFEKPVVEKDNDIVARLLQRPWFTRIWVIQEVARSRAAVVICGTHCVSWDCFARWPFRAITSRNSQTSKWQPIVVRKAKSAIPGILNYASGYTPSTGSDSLLQILHENRGARSTDARDKIFGILGLMADITPYQYLINYSLDARTIYVSVAWRILRDTQSLRLLSAAGLLVSDEELPMFRDKLPTWVPDWSYAGREVPFGLGKTFAEPFNAGGRNCLIYEDAYGGELSVRGIKVASVTAAGAIAKHHRDGLVTNDTIDSWKRLFQRFNVDTAQSPLIMWKNMFRPWKYANEAISLHEAFVETISACPPSAVSDRSSSDTTLQHRSGLAIPPEVPEHVLRRIERVTHDRRFFLSEKHDCTGKSQVFKGLGPAALQEGDIIVVLLGGPVPYLLRPAAGLHTYTLVGECYVHGIMNGEALHHVRDEAEASGCMLPPTSVPICHSPLEAFTLI